MKVRITKEQLRQATESTPEKPLVSYRITGKQPFIHGSMKYRCKKCGKEWFMYLETGVEDQGKNGRPHQPCPFIIACQCGGMAQDISGYIPLPEPRPLFPGMVFFAYDDRNPENPQACGIKSIYIPKSEDIK